MSDSPTKEEKGEVSPDHSDHDDDQAHEAFDFDVKEQDRWLPIANVARIMKTALPDNAKIAKEAKECMQECVSEFISFITSEASEKCQQEKRKTVNGEDILFAMASTGFENYCEALKIYLAKYRESQAQRNDQPVNSQQPQQTPSSASVAYGTATAPTAIATGNSTSQTSAYQSSDSNLDHIIAPHGLQSTQDSAFGGAFAPSTAAAGVASGSY